ncbi:Uncharacterized protein BM_BM1950 [Brugia malayi]|nr:Uncharacterized protein BM_BM1950 [Brugia malayi]VIO88805.1 Uncharacterized protein BM_BM1950 [Brugia malayi]
MKGTLIVDVGSRLGAVLYAVYSYSSGLVNAIGIEMNEDFCKLQKRVIENNGMEANVKVINDDVRKQAKVVSAADVIVLHNVFSFFLPLADQTECWEFLRKSTRPGTAVISNPAIEAITEHLILSFSISDWLEKIETGYLVAQYAGVNQDLFNDCVKLTLYKVKHRDEAR